MSKMVDWSELCTQPVSLHLPILVIDRLCELSDEFVVPFWVVAESLLCTILIGMDFEDLLELLVEDD